VDALPLERIRRILHLRAGVDDLEDPLRPGQRLDHAVHSPHGKPHAIGELGVLHQGVGCWCLEWAEPHIQIMKGEGDLQARVLEVSVDIAGMYCK